LATNEVYLELQKRLRAHENDLRELKIELKSLQSTGILVFNLIIFSINRAKYIIEFSFL
jgi:hypothetical protein